MDKINKKYFGKTKNNEDIYIYSLTNKNNIEIDIINYGGTVLNILVPDENNNLVDICLGYKNILDYENQDVFMGALIGRFANRIEDSKFVLNNKEYKLYNNDGKNHLHGGKIGFDKKVWQGRIINNTLSLKYNSPDLEEGYPGNLEVEIRYSLDDDNNFIIDYYGKSDKDTICNLTNHSYFNLNGHNSGDILSHELKLYADYFTQNKSGCLPNGIISEVENTPMDFREFRLIGENIDNDFDQLKMAGGYDSNWIINEYDGSLKKAAIVKGDKTKISLSVYTTMPGIQFYSGNSLNNKVLGKDNAQYIPRTGFCLETQYFPNALMHDNFIQPILKANEEYRETTIYKIN